MGQIRQKSKSDGNRCCREHRPPQCSRLYKICPQPCKNRPKTRRRQHLSAKMCRKLYHRIMAVKETAPSTASLHSCATNQQLHRSASLKRPIAHYSRVQVCTTASSCLHRSLSSRTNPLAHHANTHLQSLLLNPSDKVLLLARTWMPMRSRRLRLPSRATLDYGDGTRALQSGQNAYNHPWTRNQHLPRPKNDQRQHQPLLLKRRVQQRRRSPARSVRWRRKMAQHGQSRLPRGYQSRPAGL